MAKVIVQIPESLGLSDEQTNDLKQKFESHVVDAIKASTSAIDPAAKYKSEHMVQIVTDAN